MKLTIGCIFMLVLVALLYVVAARENVGLYAPDRYDGIPEMCLMPMDFGYCRAKVKRYYFDMRRMKCTMFYWGGCAGNVNNFKSLEDCNKVCLEAIENNAYIDNNSAPTYSSNAIRKTPTFVNKLNTNNNDSNNNSNSNTPTHINTNFSKYKINRNFNIPSTQDNVEDED